MASSLRILSYRSTVLPGLANSAIFDHHFDWVNYFLADKRLAVVAG